jgi:hypothetical protein
MILSRVRPAGDGAADKPGGDGAADKPGGDGAADKPAGAAPTHDRARCRRALVRRWVVDPTVRGLTGFPLAVAAVPAALLGGAAGIGRLQSRLVRRFAAGTRVPAAAPSAGAGQVIAHSTLVLLPAAVSLAVVAMQLFCVYSGYLYPLRPDTIAALGHPFTPDPQVLSGAWGGPTLVGAWFVHACVAFGIQAIGAVLLHGLCAAQNRAARWLPTD